jgi:hypothetical protein
MKRSGQLITLSLTAMLVLGGCAHITLSAGGKQGGAGHAAGGAGGGRKAAGGDPVLNPNATPPIDGDWKVSFVYGEDLYDSIITFAQKGKALTGSGEDSAGKFFIQSGTVDGKNIKFTKKYADADPTKSPVIYSGELEWEDDAEYRGWRMGGHYKTTAPDGRVVDDKWVAISVAAEQATQAAAAAPPEPQPQQASNQEEQQPEQVASGPVGDLSGKYTAEYSFNFKKIRSTIWLEQDENRLRGHGVDLNTNERFSIPKGWYNGDTKNITIVCHYQKGSNAASTRDLTIKAQVGPGPSLKGEHSFGGSWSAKIVR